MLHWSQEASTGWTRNSGSGSITKRTCSSGQTASAQQENGSRRTRSGEAKSTKAPRGLQKPAVGSLGPAGGAIGRGLSVRDQRAAAARGSYPQGHPVAVGTAGEEGRGPRRIRLPR